MNAEAPASRFLLPGARTTAARATVVLATLGLGWLVAVVLAASFGESPLGLRSALADAGSPERFVLTELRLPRILLATVVGAALAASGAALQALLRNGLADPFVLGVSGGAALGGTLALALGAGALAASLASAAAGLPAPWNELFGGVLARSPITLCALFGAFFATGVVYAAGRFGGRLSPYAALLAGVIFNALASAAITFIKALSPPERIGELLYWLAGSLEYPEWATVAGVTVFEVAGIALMLWRASELNLLSLGDEGAASLGVDVERARRTLFFATSLCVAAAVATSGLIGFVGLIVPHVLRLWLGPDQRLLLPASVLGGAVFLVLADLLARVLFAPLGTSTPVGVLTAIIGGPVFLWLLRRAGSALDTAR